MAAATIAGANAVEINFPTKLNALLGNFPARTASKKDSQRSSVWTPQNQVDTGKHDYVIRLVTRKRRLGRALERRSGREREGMKEIRKAYGTIS